MDAQPGLDDLVAALRADVSSGAAPLARRAAETMRAAAVRLPATSQGELRDGLGRLAREVLRAQPAMAPMVHLAIAVLDAVDGADDLRDARRAGAAAAQAFGDEVDERRRRVVRNAESLLPEEGAVLTVSSSSTVRALLLGRERRGSLRVVCLEGRPLMEGRTLAADLARHGVPVTLAVDAAAGSLVPECARVLAGADSIGDLGVVNKIGTRAAAEAANRAAVPFHVIADRTKILPPGFPQHLADNRPADEVWDAAEGIDVWNRYFEALPLDLVTSLVTDAGVFASDQVEDYRRGLRVPDALRPGADESSP